MGWFISWRKRLPGGFRIGWYKNPSRRQKAAGGGCGGLLLVLCCCLVGVSVLPSNKVKPTETKELPATQARPTATLEPGEATFKAMVAASATALKVTPTITLVQTSTPLPTETPSPVPPTETAIPDTPTNTLPPKTGTFSARATGTAIAKTTATAARQVTLTARALTGVPTSKPLPVATTAPTAELPAATVAPTVETLPTNTAEALPTNIAPPASGFTVIMLTSPIGVNANATLQIQTVAGASCSLTYYAPSGSKSGAAGLGATTADGNGVCSWTWKIGGNTTRGTGTLTITSNGATQSLPIVIQ